MYGMKSNSKVYKEICCIVKAVISSDSEVWLCKSHVYVQ